MAAGPAGDPLPAARLPIRLIAGCVTLFIVIAGPFLGTLYTRPEPQPAGVGRDRRAVGVAAALLAAWLIAHVRDNYPVAEIADQDGQIRAQRVRPPSPLPRQDRRTFKVLAIAWP